MRWVLITYPCCVAGEPREPGSDPIQVSSSDAKLLITQGLAVAAEAPAPVCKPRSPKPPSEK